MTQPRTAALALAAAALLAAAPSRAAPLSGRAVITQNSAALNGVAAARQRDNAVINSVQRNIRSGGRRRY